MVEEDLSHAETQQTVTICILTAVLIISPLIIFLVRNATQTIQVFQDSLSLTTISIVKLVYKNRHLPADWFRRRQS